MKIAIITRGRVGNLHTLAALPVSWARDTFIVCPPSEVEQHRARHPMVNVLPECTEMEGRLNYSQKFHRIVNGCYPELGRKVLIMDDDLRFSMRDECDDGTLVKASQLQIMKGLDKLNNMLEMYPLVGLHPRAMGNNARAGIKECTRINAMQGVNLDKIGHIKLDHWPILADMVLNLSLLTKGLKTAIWCDLFWDQVGGSNSPGGCSLHRTPEQQKEAVYGLKLMFPKVVTVQLKEVKKGWFGEGTQRIDFRIQWVKAYKMGLEL